ncbi:hypothetical protein OROHE_000443 [Orobanche hederae]
MASISVGLKRKFLPLLKEGHIIFINKFQVLENRSNFQNAKIKHEKRIGFGLATKYVLGEVKTRNISIESVEMRNGKAAKCDITLVDADGTQLTCVLWESFANQLKLFMDNMSTSDTKPVIMALQFAMVLNYRAIIKVSTMKHASRFFIRPDIQEVKDFILSEEWLNASSLRTIKEIVNSDAVGTYTCRGTIDDFHPEEPLYYQSCGNKRCYKDVPKRSKTNDNSGTPHIMSTMLDRPCLFKVEVTVRFRDRVHNVKNVTEDAEMMAQFYSISYAGKFLHLKNCGTPVDDNAAQEAGASGFDNDETREFAEWILNVGDGIAGDALGDGEAAVTLSNDILIRDAVDPIAAIVESICPDVLQTTSNAEIFKDTAILGPLMR